MATRRRGGATTLGRGAPAGVYRELEAIEPVHLAKSPDDHLREPLQAITRRVAADPGSWDRTTFAQVRAIFDERAPTWAERADATYRRPLLDALARGGIAAGGTCADVGSATGIHNAALLERFDRLVSIDLSYEMLTRAPSDGARRVLADAGALPLREASCAAVVLVNCFCFVPECLRVVSPGGVVVFVSTRDDATPIYLPPAELAGRFAALEPRARALGAKVGIGRWTVVRLP